MKIKIMFDDEVVRELEVKNAEISESREVTGIFRTADFKATGVHKCIEIAPSVMNKICIVYLSDDTMPNSEFYTMENKSLPHKTKNIRYF